MRRSGPFFVVIALLLAAALPAAAGARSDQGVAPTQGGAGVNVAPRAQDITLIDHIVVIMQENRSFDHYFGTYHSPSGMKVAGIPKKPSGSFAVCIPDPALGHCVGPYHSKTPRQIGGPHGYNDSVRDVNGGKMDGFARSVAVAHDADMQYCAMHPFTQRCKGQVGPNGEPDVMSFFTRADIPNYYALADWGVLQDHMFEPVDSYSLPSHMFLTSAWAASCTNPMDPMSCHSDPQVKGNGPYPWTDITWLLDKQGVTWKYYVGDGTNLNCPQYPCVPNDPKTATPAL